MLQIAALSVEQDALEDAAEAAEGIFPELNEFIVLADEQIGGGGNHEDDVSPLPAPMFKWLQVDYNQKGTTAKYLGEIARTLNISPNGNKRAVFNRIRER